MIDQIVKMLGGIGADIWMYICAGLIVLGFIIGLVLCMIGGDVGKFKKAAKIVIASPDPKSGNRSAKQMPVKVTKLYKRSRATGEKPGDVIGIDACVNTPYLSSFCAKFAGVMMFISVFAVVLMAATGYIAAAEKALTAADQAAANAALSAAYAPVAVVAAAGLLFTVAAFVVSLLSYKNAVKTYDKYIAALDTLAGNGGFDHINLEDSGKETVVSEAQGETVIAAQEQESGFAPAKEAISYGAVSTGFSYSEPSVSTGGMSYQAPAYEESPSVAEAKFEPVISTPAYNPAPVISTPAYNPAPVISTPAAAPEQETVITPPAAAPEPKAPLTAQDLRARAEQARQERAARAAEQARQEPQGVSGSADELIARIEKASAEGAPLSTMKEIAIQLNQERQKPENKNPETSKRLADAQILLIRAMSSAMRR